MISCCVPFCNKRRGDRKGDPLKQYAEWICGKHWDLLPKKQRRLFKRTQRRARDTGKRRDINKANWLWMVLKTRVMRRASVTITIGGIDYQYTVIGVYSGTARGIGWLDNIPEMSFIVEEPPRLKRELLWRPEWPPTIFEPLPAPPRSKNTIAAWSLSPRRPQETHARPPVRADPSCLLHESSFSSPP